MSSLRAIFRPTSTRASVAALPVPAPFNFHPLRLTRPLLFSALEEPAQQKLQHAQAAAARSGIKIAAGHRLGVARADYADDVAHAQLQLFEVRDDGKEGRPAQRQRRCGKGAQLAKGAAMRDVSSASFAS